MILVNGVQFTQLKFFFQASLLQLLVMTIF